MEGSKRFQGQQLLRQPFDSLCTALQHSPHCCVSPMQPRSGLVPRSFACLTDARAVALHCRHAVGHKCRVQVTKAHPRLHISFFQLWKHIYLQDSAVHG